MSSSAMLCPSVPALRRSAAARPTVRARVVVTKAAGGPRFGADKEEASTLAMVCGQCGYVYRDVAAFQRLPSSFKCPVCKAPKGAFEEKDTAGAVNPLPLVLLLAALVAGGYYALQKL